MIIFKTIFWQGKTSGAPSNDPVAGHGVRDFYETVFIELKKVTIHEINKYSICNLLNLNVLKNDLLKSAATGLIVLLKNGEFFYAFF
jgi:hypothetical protein